jgi:twin BRCT domain
MVCIFVIIAGCEIFSSFILSGGKYCRDLETHFTHILVVGRSSGEKFSYAKLCEIACVSEAWIYDSAKAGFSKKHTDYPVEEKQTCTPKDGMRKILLCIFF